MLNIFAQRMFNKKRKIKFPKSKWVKNALDLTRKKDVDLIVELVGGSDGIAKKIDFFCFKK